MEDKKKLISVVFSFRNEEKNIEELLKRTHETIGKFNNYSYELIFVNDSSTDNSLDLLKENQKNYPIKIIDMSRRFGGTACRIAGFKNSSGDLIVDMDSDLQDPPELIEKLIKRSEEGIEIVHTIRTKRHGEPLLKMFFTKIGYKLINFFAEINLMENAGDFKLYSRKALNHILNINEYDPYVRGLSVWVGFKQDFIEYEREKRFSGETHYSWLSPKSVFSTRSPFSEFFRGITSFSNAPLYVSFFAGLILFIFSIFLIVYAIMIKFLDLSSPGVPTLIVLQSFFGGLILLNVGVLGIYLGKIFNQIKGRPKYVIKEIFNKKNED